MGPAGPVQRLTVGEGVKKKKYGPYIFRKKEKKKSERRVGGAFLVAPAVRNGDGGVEGQTEEFKIGTLLKESVKGK